MLLYKRISFVWKMIAVLFAFALMAAHATEKIPSYIKVCGRSDPNYDQCITDNLINVKDKMCAGMPEFNIPPNEPIIIDKIVIYDTNTFKLSLRDSKLFGICDFDINSVHADPDKLHFNFDILIKHVRIDTEYDIDMHILVPLANKGLLFVTTDNLPTKITIDLKVATKNGEKHVYAAKVNTNANMTALKYDFDESKKELVQLYQAFHNVVDNNTKDIIDKAKPVIEENISKVIISVVNAIGRSNYEKLFPEKA